jgi:hypothetical protein
MYVGRSSEIYLRKFEFGGDYYFQVDQDKARWNSNKCCISYNQGISLPAEEILAGLYDEVSNFLHFFIFLLFHSFFFIF